MVQRGPSSSGMVEPRSRLHKTERLGEGSLVESCRSPLYLWTPNILRMIGNSYSGFMVIDKETALSTKLL